MKIISTWHIMNRSYWSTGMYFSIVGIVNFSNSTDLWNLIGLAFSFALLWILLDFTAKRLSNEPGY